MWKKILFGLGMAAATVGSFLYMDYREDRQKATESIASRLDEKMINQALSEACYSRVCDISEKTKEQTLEHMRRVIDGKVGYELSQAKSEVARQLAEKMTTKISGVDQDRMLQDVMKEVKRQVTSRAMSAVDRGVNDMLRDLRDRAVTFTRF